MKRPRLRYLLAGGFIAVLLCLAFIPMLASPAFRAWADGSVLAVTPHRLEIGRSETGVATFLGTGSQ